MTITLILIALTTALFTILGGFFALKFKDRSHLIIGFSAGAVIGVAFFDLLPEALAINGTVSNQTITSIVAIGFMTYMIVDRIFYPKDSSHESTPQMTADLKRGNLKAGSFSVHSFLDGLGIGLAFHYSFAVGSVVTIAVLAHDFSDGINTVSAVLKSQGNKKLALRWLIVDAVAPILGVVATLFFTVSHQTLQMILAFFAGSFIYIGASDLIPESFHAHPTKWTTVSTILGIVLIYTIVRLIS